MPAQADKLMAENMNKNLIDQDEYPMTRELPSSLSLSLYAVLIVRAQR